MARKLDYNPVVVFLINLFLPLFIVSSILFIDTDIAFFPPILIYTIMLILEFKNKRFTPIVSLVLFINIVLYVVCVVYGYQDFVAYSGAVFFFSLAAMVIGFLIVKKPFTVFFSEGKSIPILEYVTSSLWGVIYFLGGIFSLIFMPSILFVILPIFLMLLGIGVTVYIHFFTFPFLQKKQKAFVFDKYTFRECGTAPEEIETFNNFFSKQLWFALRKSRKNPFKTWEALNDNIFTKMDKSSTKIIRFLAFHGDELIGTMSVILDDKKNGIPIEPALRVDLNSLRKFGSLVQVGHFTIKQKYRLRPNIFLGLFKMAADYAIENNIAFFVNFAYSFASPIYSKSGFVKIESALQHVTMNLDVDLFVFNFSERIVHSDNITDTFAQFFKSIMDPYIIERYYKRQLIKYLFRTMDKRPYNLEGDDISSLIELNREV